MNRQENFTGVDSIDFPGKADVVADLRQPWPWADGSVEEARASHFIEHLTAMERVHFANELHRVLVPGGKAEITVPHWASCRAYGDPTHAWPPVSEFWLYYLNRDWRLREAPHTDARYLPGGFACDFDATTMTYSLHPDMAIKSPQEQRFAVQWYKEAALEMIATLTCRK